MDKAIEIITITGVLDLFHAEEIQMIIFMTELKVSIAFFEGQWSHLITADCEC